MNVWHRRRRLRRRPWIGGGEDPRLWVILLKPLRCHPSWKKHGEPYSKRQPGRVRRAARQWVLRQRAALLDVGPDRDDGWFASS